MSPLGGGWDTGAPHGLVPLEPQGKFRFELLAAEQLLLEEIGDPSMKQADIILTYALALQTGYRAEIDWSKVNHAIIDRWSISGLRRIKDAAVRKVGG